MKFKFCGNIDCPDWLITEIIFLTKISSVKLRILCNQICTFIITKCKNFEAIKKILEEMNFTEQEAKTIISVLDFILKHSAKFDVEDLVLNQELLQLGLSQENADSISKVFKNQKKKLRDFLKNDIFGFNTITSIDYKMSYVLCDQSSNFECENEKENPDIAEDNYQIKSLDKNRINLLLNIANKDKPFSLSMDKETLGKLIQDLEKYSAVIKQYKELE